jgi:Tol biopolymer transport system component
LELSDDGASLAMTSWAPDLGGVRDFNGADDVFAFDASSREVSLLSRRDESRPSRSGGQGSDLPFHRYADGSPDGPFLSEDGRFVLLSSAAQNLTPQLSGRGLFLVDRFTGIPTLVTHHFDDPNQGLEGTRVAEGASLSADGRFVAYLSDSTWLVPGGGLATDCYVWDRTTNVNRRVTSDCVDVSLSADGHFVAYVSGTGVYLLDQTNGTTQLVSHRAGSTALASGGASTAPTSSSDGRFVAFLSSATDLVAGGTSGNQLFLFDRQAGTSVLVSHAAGPPGASANDASSKPSIAADGSYVAFVSLATDLVAGQVDAVTTEDVFLYERDTGLNRLVSHAQAAPSMATGFPVSPVGRPLLSADGRYVAFTSYGSNLVAGQQEPSLEFPTSDAFLYDRVTDSNVLVSHAASSPLLAAGSSGVGALSPDGGRVLFGSSGWNLVPGQVGAAAPQAFLFERSTGGITLVSGTGGSGSQSGNDWSMGAGLSRDPTVALLASAASDLVADDLNDASDVFVYLSDVSPPSGPLVFHTVPPCRLADTRLAAGEWGGPAVHAGEDRYFTVAGQCGIPISAKAVSLNVTVTLPSAPGDLRLFAGGAAPLASAINYRPGQTRANNSVVFMAAGGSIALRCDQISGSVHVLLDVSGYFE